MIHAPIDRRMLLAGGGAIAAAMTVPFGRVMAAAAEELRPIPIPPPISSAERLQRIAKARSLMQQNGIGSIVVESGPSLDYRHALFRAALDRREPVDSGRDPHLERGRGTAQAGRRFPPRARGCGRN